MPTPDKKKKYPPGIRPAPDGRQGWQVRYRGPDGRQRTKTFKEYGDAKAWQAHNTVQMMRGEWVNPSGGNNLFRDRYDRWLATTVNLRASTRARDESYARSLILPTFADSRLGTIGHDAIQEWVAELTRDGYAASTVHKAHQILRKVMQSAVDARQLNSNPCDATNLPKVEREEQRFLTPAEVNRLAEVIDPRYRPLVLVAAYGGLRAGELFGLNRGRVDLVRSTVDVAEILVEVKGHHTFGPPKTRAGRRVVPLPRVVTDELADHVAGLEPAELVFTSPKGEPMRASLFRRRFWQPAIAAANLEPLRLHDLRHTAVAFWIAAGATPNEIAARAGHSSVVTVLDRYGHLLPGLEDKVTDKLDAMARLASTGTGGDVVPFKRRS